MSDQIVHYVNKDPFDAKEIEQLTPDQLRDGWWSALESFYSLSSISRRVLRHRRR